MLSFLCICFSFGGVDDTSSAGDALVPLGSARIPTGALLSSANGTIGGTTEVSNSEGEVIGSVDYQMAILWPLPKLHEVLLAPASDSENQIQRSKRGNLSDEGKLLDEKHATAEGIVPDENSEPNLQIRTHAGNKTEIKKKEISAQRSEERKPNVLPSTGIKREKTEAYKNSSSKVGKESRPKMMANICLYLVPDFENLEDNSFDPDLVQVATVINSRYLPAPGKISKRSESGGFNFVLTCTEDVFDPSERLSIELREHDGNVVKTIGYLNLPLNFLENANRRKTAEQMVTLRKVCVGNVDATAKLGVVHCDITWSICGT